MCARHVQCSSNGIQNTFMICIVSAMKQLGTSIKNTENTEMETKTSANRHLTLLYMRHVTFMLIVEIQQRQRAKKSQQRMNETNLKFHTRHIMFLMFVFIARRRHRHRHHFICGMGKERQGKLHIGL